jgi:Tfp pilus assembly protein PilX
MKNYIVTFILLTSAFSKVFAQSNEMDYSDCLTKVSSAWSTVCSQCNSPENTYRVNFKNICSEAVESKVCVREKSNRWRIFHFRFIAPGDTVTAYACDATGKYMHITRKAGDLSVVLPADDEIQKIK